MRQHLKIEGEEVQNLSSIIVSEFYRNESQKVTLSGGLAIDRGEIKLKLSARIRSASLAQIKNIERKLSKIFVTAEFYYRGELVEKRMAASPIPKYTKEYLNESEKEPYYRNIEFTLEEQ